MEPTIVENFTEFLKDVTENNAYSVEFTINDKTYTIKYSELTSGEEAKIAKEFERWFKDYFANSDEKKEKDVSFQQFRYYKMLAKHMHIATFDDFIKMPRAIIGAMVVAIEEDLLKRYPHIKKQFDMALGRMG